MKITERAVLIGSRKTMAGVLTQPAQPDLSAPAIMLVNGGILPRWGRSRIYVTLARRLAGVGYRVIRFDLSGIGDSLSRGDGLPPTEAAVADVAEALDWLVGANGSAIIIGLCDGANLAAYQASIDRRVVGVTLLDPLIPRTRRYRVTHLWRRLSSATTWRELVTGRHPVWRMLRNKAHLLAGSDHAGPGFNPNDPQVRSALTKIYQSIVDHDVETLAIFSGGMQHRHCYREQMIDAFPSVAFGSRLTLEYFPANDHHFEWPSHQTWLLNRVTEWIAAAPFRRPDAKSCKISPGDKVRTNAAEKLQHFV